MSFECCWWLWAASHIKRHEIRVWCQFFSVVARSPSKLIAQLLLFLRFATKTNVGATTVDGGNTTVAAVIAVIAIILAVAVQCRQHGTTLTPAKQQTATSKINICISSRGFRQINRKQWINVKQLILQFLSRKIKWQWFMKTALIRYAHCIELYVHARSIRLHVEP